MSGLSKVVINVGQGGIGRRATNTDKISGLLFFAAVLPSGFGVSDRVKKVFSLAEAETLGIAKGSANHDVMWYHISEFFRANPEGELWIGIYAVPGGSYTYAEMQTMQLVAGGEIKQFGIYAEARTFAAADCTAVQAICDLMDAAGMPASVLLAENMAAIVAVTGWAGVTDLRTLTARKVSVVVSEDGGGYGKTLATAKSYSITTLGHALGMVSRASVEQSIGNPANFNASDGTELEIPALANGDLVSALTDAGLGSLKDKGYLILRKYLPKISGSYYERVPTAVVSTSDFAWMEVNRVVDKAIRLVQTALTPQLNGTVSLKADGSLRDDTIGFYQDLAQTPLTQMEVDGEISASDVLINPSQNVLASSQLVVTIKIVPVGIAEEIVINIGLTTSL